MKVWIDQDLCTGDGLCEEIAPDVFTLLDDGLAYVKEGSRSSPTRAAPKGWPTSRPARKRRPSSPPKSAPESASSSKSSDRTRSQRGAQVEAVAGQRPVSTSSAADRVQHGADLGRGERVGDAGPVGGDGEGHADHPPSRVDQRGARVARLAGRPRAPARRARCAPSRRCRGRRPGCAGRPGTATPASGPPPGWPNTAPRTAGCTARAAARRGRAPAPTAPRGRGRGRTRPPPRRPARRRTRSRVVRGSPLTTCALVTTRPGRDHEAGALLDPAARLAHHLHRRGRGPGRRGRVDARHPRRRAEVGRRPERRRTPRE